MGAPGSKRPQPYHQADSVYAEAMFTLYKNRKHSDTPRWPLIQQERSCEDTFDAKSLQDVNSSVLS